MTLARQARRRGPRGLLAVGLGALLIGAPGLACGDDGSGTGTAERPVPAGAIETGDFNFEPATKRVAAGDPVVWFNAGEQLHTVKGPGFSSQAFGSGEEYRHRFQRPGSYPYVCTLHPTRMAGTVVVE